MDLQGTPIGSTNQGLKNTTDPRARVPVSESAGPVASDSLAAESYNDNGKFSENRNAAPSGASGASSTLNNTDTSAARKLDSTSSAGERGTEGEGQKYPEGLGGQPSFSGNTSSLGYTGGPSAGYQARDSSNSGNSGNDGNDGDSSSTRKTTRSGNTYGDKSNSSTDATGSSGYDSNNNSSSSENNSSNNNNSSSNNRNNTRNNNDNDDNDNSNSNNSNNNNNNSSVDKAPNYIADVYLADTNKPKGKNLTEDPNLDGNRNEDYEIGDNNDPGRAALKDFEKANASGGQSGRGQSEIDGENAFDSLKSDDRA